MFDEASQAHAHPLVAAARDFAQTVLLERAERLNQTRGFPTESLKQAAELGLLGIALAPELGGQGASPQLYPIIVEALASACPSTTVALCVSNMVAEVVAAFGTPEQRQRHVPALCRGDYIVGGFALSETEAGSDPGSMRTRAVKTASGYRISGAKQWISSGTHAGLFVVWARTGEALGTRGISAFLVPGDTKGLTRGPCERKLGLHGSTTTSLIFEDCEVGPDALLGQEGQGFKIAMMALDGGRIGIAAQAIGIANAALKQACHHANTRKQFGQTIGEFQGIQWPLADSATELSAARLLTGRAAWRKANNLPFSHEAAMAKLFASERANLICDRALQVLGGHGYTTDSLVERYLRDVRVTTIYEGASEIQRIVIAREILKAFEK